MNMPSMMRVVLLACAFFGANAIAVEPRAVSGAYYNPAQSGHGFSVEALDDGRAIAFWYVYDRDGNPVHLYIEGPLTSIDETRGLRLSGRAYLASGMRFGAFNPSELALRQWGDVTLDLSCEGATLRYDGNGPAGANYGSGTMTLTRLAAIEGVSRDEDCRVVAGQRYEPAVLAGSYDRIDQRGERFSGTLQGAIDERGEIWLAGLEREAPVLSLSAERVTTLFIARGGARAGVLNGHSGLPRSARGSFAMSAFDGPAGITVTAIDAPFDTGDAPRYSPSPVESIKVLPQASDTAAMHRPVSFSLLEGRSFTSSLITQSVRFDEQGQFCVVSLPRTCVFRGEIASGSSTWSFFDFTMRPDDAPTRAAFKGRGWVLFGKDGQPRQLTLIGVTGGESFAFVGDAMTAH